MKKKNCFCRQLLRKNQTYWNHKLIDVEKLTHEEIDVILVDDIRYPRLIERMVGFDGEIINRPPKKWELDMFYYVKYCKQTNIREE